MATSFAEHRPRGAARAVAEALWSRTASPDEPIRVLPDGCIDLVYRYRPGHAGGELLIAGPDRRARLVAAPPDVAFLGVRFHPGAARALLDVDPAPLVDAGTVPVAAVGPMLARMEARLADLAPSPGVLARRFEAEVEALVATRPRRAPQRVQAALALLERSGGTAAIGAVARALGTTPRTLHRDLVAWTGLGPKTLGRIVRFRVAQGLLQGGGTLAHVAAEAGFADQAHMTREFRALAGLPPGALG